MAEPYPIIAGYATIGQGAGPMIVTERAGLFTRHGLQVETRLMRGAAGVVRGLMEGEIQFGNLAAPALLRSVLVEGADLAFLTGEEKKGTQTFSAALNAPPFWVCRVGEG